MKKRVNKLWVAIIAAAALVVGACCSNKTVEINGEQLTKRELRARIDSLRAIVEDREMSCVYGSPEIIEEYGRETRKLREELNILQQELDNFGKKH